MNSGCHTARDSTLVLVVVDVFGRLLCIRAERRRAPAELSDEGEQEPRFPDQNTAAGRPFDGLPSHKTGTPPGMVCFSQGEGGGGEKRRRESRALSIAAMEIE